MEKVGSCGEHDSLYGNEIEANKETNLGACTITVAIDINSEPGHDGADKQVDSEKADNAVEILKTSSESMKVIQDKC